MKTAPGILSFLAAAALISLSAPAHADRAAKAAKADRIRDDIFQLTELVRTQLAQSTADKKDLKEVRRHLEDALAILEGRVVPGPQGGPPPLPQPEPVVDRYVMCVEFVARGYSQTLSAAMAQDRANEDCRNPNLDLEIAGLLYPSYAVSLSSGQAMERAVRAASDPALRGKVSLLQYAIKNYSQSLGGAMATERAITQARASSASRLPCLRQNYDAYLQSLSSAHAMDRAFAACSPPPLPR